MLKIRLSIFCYLTFLPCNKKVQFKRHHLPINVLLHQGVAPIADKEVLPIRALVVVSKAKTL